MDGWKFDLVVSPVKPTSFQTASISSIAYTAAVYFRTLYIRDYFHPIEHFKKLFQIYSLLNQLDGASIDRSGVT